MGLIEVKKEFTRKELLWFGPLFALFVGLLGWILIVKFALYQAVYCLWVIAAGLIVLYYLVPSIRRSIYRGWIYAVLPIGWIISHLLLAITYYFLLTPIGILMRVVGYDPMQRKFDRSRKSYWIAREKQRPAASYFKQY